MPLRNTPEAWGWLHQTVHWLVAVAVIAQLAVGFTFSNLPEESGWAPVLYAIHGTLGGSILVVMLFRLVWRLSNPVPRLPDTLSPTEKGLARANHWLLYALLIAMPLGGYLMVNARGYAVQFFGWKLPFVIEKNDALAGWIFYGHLAGGLFIVALLVLHVAAALRHEAILKDNVLRRMTPLPLRKEGRAHRPQVARHATPRRR